jgi:TetR/AcrR family transcriptional repressor of nem operon
MIRRTRSKKADTHARIVAIAAKRFRELGIHQISIADLMNEAGLTVGGFYRHFSSRDQLVVEAFIAASQDIVKWSESVSSCGQAIKDYLAEDHRDHPETGCSVAALTGDVKNESDPVRAVYTREVRRLLEFFSRLAPADGALAKRQAGMLVFSACVGALELSRSVDDPKLSGDILTAVRSLLVEMTSGGASLTPRKWRTAASRRGRS